MKTYQILAADRAPFLLTLASNYAPAFWRQCNHLRLEQCTDISRMQWGFSSLANDCGQSGGFIWPEAEKPVAMQSMNGWRGKMSPEACGIALSLTAFSWLSFTAHDNQHEEQMERLSISYHQLRNAAYSRHREADKIAAFCD